MSASLKSETGNDTFGFFAWAIFLFSGLCVWVVVINFLGIDVRLAELPGLRLLEVAALAATGCAAIVVVVSLVAGFARRIGAVLSNGLEIAAGFSETLGSKLATLSVSLLFALGKLAAFPFTRSWDLFNGFVLAPMLERRRQREELRRTYEEVKDQFGSYDEFVRSFEGEAEQDAAREEETAPPSPAPADPFAAACRLLGLADTGSFTQAELKARYHQLMKAVHPDIIGATGFATQLNEARDLIKSRERMEVMTNWLKPFSAPPAVKAPAVPAKQEFDKKLAAFKKAHGFRERYTMLCYCSRFGRPFEAAFERASSEERFCIAAVNKLAEQSSAAGRGSPSAQKRFDIREFNTTNWSCPYCRADSWISCHCGSNTCGHQLAASGGKLHKCEPGCGSVAEVVPLQEFTATAANGGPKAASSRPALPGATRPGLPPSNFPRLPGKR